MKLTDHQTSQAVAAARKLIKAHSTGFMNFDHMVKDDQIAQALTEVLAAVTDDPKMVTP